MADLKKCDRCSKTVEPTKTRQSHGWRPEQYSWSDLEIEFKADVNRKISRELCEDCTKLLLDLLKPNAVPPPIRPLPLDGSGETVRQVFQNVPAVDPELTALLAKPAVPDPLDVVMAVAEELKEPDLMILPPGPPIHIPALTPESLCPAGCGHKVKDHHQGRPGSVQSVGCLKRKDDDPSSYCPCKFERPAYL